MRTLKHNGVDVEMPKPLSEYLDKHQVPCNPHLLKKEDGLAVVIATFEDPPVGSFLLVKMLGSDRLVVHFSANAVFDNIETVTRH